MSAAGDDSMLIKTRDVSRRELGSVMIGDRQVKYSDWVISDEEPDNDGDVMRIDGLDLTPWQKQNCPVLFCHDLKVPLGSSKMLPFSDAMPDIRREGNELVARCYHLAETPEANAAVGLIEQGARINQGNGGGETPLHMAVHRRDVPMARLLMDMGADPELTDNLAGKSPRDYAQEDRRAAAVLAAINAPRTPMTTNIMAPGQVQGPR